jgi:hypothetical protein
MGQHTGAKAAGAKGRRQAMAHPSLAMSAQIAHQELVSRHSEEIRERAREHGNEAVDVLTTLMNGRKVPSQVRRAAAKDVLEIGHGRFSQPVQQPGQGGNSGLTINVIQFGDGEPVQPKTIQTEKSVQAAVEAAQEIIIGEEIPMEEIPEQEEIDEPDFAPDLG